MNKSIKTIVAILICTTPGMVAADPIVFENAYDDGTYVADTPWCSGCGDMWRVWDSFTLSDDTEITQIDARVYFSGSPSIEYSIWTLDGETELFSQILTAQQFIINPLAAPMQSDLIGYITGPQLSAGDYLLSIWDLGDPDFNFGWFSTSQNGPGSAHHSSSQDGTGHAGGGNNREMAFRIYGNADVIAVAVPEPGTFVLLGLGLAGIGYSRRRRAAGAIA